MSDRATLPGRTRLHFRALSPRAAFMSQSAIGESPGALIMHCPSERGDRHGPKLQRGTVSCPGSALCMCNVYYVMSNCPLVPLAVLVVGTHGQTTASLATLPFSTFSLCAIHVHCRILHLVANLPLFGFIIMILAKGNYTIAQKKEKDAPEWVGASEQAK